MRTRTGRLLAGAILAASAVFPSSGPAWAAPPPAGAALEAPTTWIGGQEGEQIDLKAYADFNDVDLATAAAEVGDLPKLRQLQATLETTYPNTYAGLWINHHPYAVTVAGTDAQDRDAMTQLAAGLDLNRPPTVVLAARSLRDLRTTASSIKKLGLQADLEINYAANNVIVRSVDVTSTKAPVLNVAQSAMVSLKQVASLAQPSTSIYGGMGGDAIQWSGCPSGFSVRRYVANQGWEYGIVTAGHCGNALSYRGSTLPYVKQCLGGNCDSQYHTDGIYTAQPYFYWTSGQPPRSALGTRSWSAQIVGETVCHYGTVTGYGCGRLAGKEYNVSWVPNSGSTWVYVDPDCQRDLSSPGDSGGPLFYGNTAYGIMSGYFNETFCQDKSWAVYGAIDLQVGGVAVSVYLQ
jgi:hypothetical protein